jgi:probable rRNA maturation factor
MNNVAFFNQTSKDIIELEELRKLIEYAVEKEKLNNVEFSVIFVNNDKIHELNKQYRQIDKPTDVLTFALEDNNDIIKMDTRLLGDIYISIDKAREQAQEYGHSYLRELAFLMIHGFLHLLGYDHMNEIDEKEMFSRQEEILNEYGIKKK